LNSSAGLVVEVEGQTEALENFAERLEREKPTASVVNVRESAWIATEGATRFEILAGDHQSAKTVNVLPDLATCPQCREELFDPADRRFHYPFTNCTNCGPRYTIVVDIPYDRPNTTMREFVFCPRCKKEYEDPSIDGFMHSRMRVRYAARGWMARLKMWLKPCSRDRLSLSRALADFNCWSMRAMCRLWRDCGNVSTARKNHSRS
jgi:HypF finger